MSNAKEELQRSLAELAWIKDDAKEDIRDFLVDLDIEQASPELLDFLRPLLWRFLLDRLERSRVALSKRVADIVASENSVNT